MSDISVPKYFSEFLEELRTSTEEILHSSDPENLALKKDSVQLNLVKTKNDWNTSKQRFQSLLSKYYFNEHMRTHSGEIFENSQVRNEEFLPESKSSQHVRIETTGKKYQCAVCQKNFTLRQNLRRHVSAVHEKEKTHQCGVCYKAFNQRYGLRRHMEIHEGGKLPIF